MNADDLCFAGAAEQARLIRDGEVSVTEIVSSMLDRVGRVDPAINSYRVVMAAEALAAAAVADRHREHRGWLCGVPVAIKDHVDVAGQTTTWGTAGNTRPAERDSPIVSALRDAGAIIIGKTTCSELLAWPFTETPTWGATHNPWDTAYSPGGSSGGSAAAVAAGLCGVALGSDGLGSIRVPASFTGMFGLKPQHGRTWHPPADWNGLSVNGPIAARVADAALFLDATAIRAPSEPYSVSALREPRPLRIALAWKPLAPYPLAAPLETERRLAVEQMADLLGGLGHDIVEQEVGFPRSLERNYIWRYLDGVRASLGELDDPERVEHRTRQLAMAERLVSKRWFARSRSNEAKRAERVNAIFDRFDVVLTPGTVEAPLRVGALDGSRAFRTFYEAGRKIPHFAPWNGVGNPAASISAGFDRDGLPMSVQLVGPPDGEAVLLGVAHQIETTQPWTARPRL